MADIDSQNVFTGTIAEIRLGTHKIGLCQSVEGRRGFFAEPVYGVGQWQPADIVQHKYLVRLSVSKFFIRLATLDALGVLALGSDILSMGLLSLQIRDTVRGVPIRTYVDCVCNEYNEVYKANAICGENAMWICRKVTGDPSAISALTMPPIKWLSALK